MAFSVAGGNLNQQLANHRQFLLPFDICPLLFDFSFGLTVAVTTRDSHPLPYSPGCNVAGRAPESTEKNLFNDEARYHAFPETVNPRKKKLEPQVAVVVKTVACW